MSKAVAKNQSSALSTIDFGLGDDYQGIELQSKDVVLPHIQLLQKGVDWEELDEIAWKPGDFFNSATQDVIKGAFEALVVDMKVTTKMMGPKDADGRRETLKFSQDGIHWDDGSMISAEDRKSDDPEDFLNGAAVDSYHYVVILKGTDFPILLTFKGASYRNAKTLNFALSRMIPTWKCWTKFSSEEGVSGANKFKKLVGKVQPKKLLADQDMAMLALETWKASKNQRIKSKELDAEDSPTY